MKVGDQMIVHLGQFEVAMATIEDISDGKATILIPSTRVVMGVRQELAPLEQAPEVDRVMAGLTESTEAAVSTAQEELVQAPTTQTQAPVEAAQSVSEYQGSLRSMNLDSSAIDGEPT